ncbi:phage holin family protein [Brevibacillus daliensis]|uniref:phage holin family protein n=1 Tax=Brevibacillus daliensis TaxID=2892995 RepID=UPI001E5AE360|nr:phage holin family protein [Brevibacillus daliensis]
MYITGESPNLFWTGASIALLTYLVGGMDQLFTALCIFVIVDYITGVIAAWYTRVLNSRDGFKGIGRKLAMFLFIVVAHQLDVISGSETGLLRDAVILFLISNEGISIVENCHRLGIPVPSFLLQALKKVRNMKK